MILYYEPDGTANAVLDLYSASEARVNMTMKPPWVMSWTTLADELWSKARPPPSCTGAILNHIRVECYTTLQSISSYRNVPALSPPMSNPTQANPCVDIKHDLPFSTPATHQSEPNCYRHGSMGEGRLSVPRAVPGVGQCLSLHQGLTTNGQEPATLITIADSLLQLLSSS